MERLTISITREHADIVLRALRVLEERNEDLAGMDHSHDQKLIADWRFVLED